MKKSIKISAAGIALASLMLGTTACNDLDTKPQGSVITIAQKEATIQANPSMAEAGLNSLPKSLRQWGKISSSAHHDFGYPSIIMCMDQRGMDMTAPDNGYNWYSAASDMSDFNANYLINYFYWNTYYSAAFNANGVLASIPAETDNVQNKFNRAQALCTRAFSYFNLANMYAFTYDGHQSDPCVPIITDENADEVAQNGCARSTVEETYAQILSDLDEAVKNLDEAAQQGIKRQTKDFYSAAAAYGLRARVHLTMRKWAEAAADADAAIARAASDGLRPYSMQEVSRPAFSKISDPAWILGITFTSSDPVNGVNNYASMMGPWMSNGYCSVGMYRYCNYKLYDAIPASDVRKSWFCDRQGNIPSTLPAQYVAYAAEMASPLLPCSQVKFAAADDTPGTTNGAVDVPMMRVEEMYLIKAEAEGMQNPATGKATLENFVKQYRDPAYTCTATTAEEFSDAVWMQRRIELWGEGFSYFDLQRLKKTIDRRGCGFPTAWVFVVGPEERCRLLTIVQSEQNANPLLGKVETATQPVAVPDVDE